MADAIAAGAARLMLLMFSHAAEVAAFKQAAGTTPVTLLVEPAAALARLPVILPLLGAQDRVHFGLNDLSLDMKLGFLFEVVGGRLPSAPGSDTIHHFIVFGAIALPIAFARPSAFIWIILGVSTYGGLIEILQPHVGRHGDFMDAIAIVGGAICGSVLGQPSLSTKRLSV